jgi:hypothetical protein
MSAPGTGMFRSLGGFNYRMWIAGSFVSNVGTWVQRTAQDCLVLTVLTHHSAGGGVGIVMALQFAPRFLLLPWPGSGANHLDRRKLLIVTQVVKALTAMPSSPTLSTLSRISVAHLGNAPQAFLAATRALLRGQLQRGCELAP